MTDIIQSYLGLCKLKVVALIVFTAMVGMFLATSPPGMVPWDVLLFGNLGIGMAASAAAAINHVLDAREDATSLEQFAMWADKVLSQYRDESELTIVISDEEQSQQLNNDYRGKNKPTNVLSFEFEAPPGIDIPLVGDLIICPAIVLAEAQLQYNQQS